MRQDDSLYTLPLLTFGVILMCQLLLSDINGLEGPLSDSNTVTEEVSLNSKEIETQESPMAADTVSVTEMQAHQQDRTHRSRSVHRHESTRDNLEFDRIELLEKLLATYDENSHRYKSRRANRKCCCNHGRQQPDKPSGPPTYNRLNGVIEVVHTGSSWQLLSTRCHIEKNQNGHTSYLYEYRHWAELYEQPVHGEYRTRPQISRVETLDYVFKDVSITFITKAPRCGYSKEVWAAISGKPLPIPGSIIRKTWEHQGSCVVRRDQILGPGKLITRVQHPDDSVQLDFSAFFSGLHDIGRALLPCIFGALQEDSNLDEID
ncbi:Ff.00g056560.m01.CDS01 [Fusarium sp. VM40]|nr:Ff.00g056560.m01.CDS01 [Fusarium sp. VM40]